MAGRAILPIRRNADQQGNASESFTEINLIENERFPRHSPESSYEVLSLLYKLAKNRRA